MVPRWRLWRLWELWKIWNRRFSSSSFCSTPETGRYHQQKPQVHTLTPKSSTQYKDYPPPPPNYGSYGTYKNYKREAEAAPTDCMKSPSPATSSRHLLTSYRWQIWEVWEVRDLQRLPNDVCILWSLQACSSEGTRMELGLGAWNGGLRVKFDILRRKLFGKWSSG